MNLDPKTGEIKFGKLLISKDLMLNESYLTQHGNLDLVNDFGDHVSYVLTTDVGISLFLFFYKNKMSRLCIYFYPIAKDIDLFMNNKLASIGGERSYEWGKVQLNHNLRKDSDTKSIVISYFNDIQ